MKYTGNDYEGDMQKVAEDPETQRWWAVTDGMQSSFNDGATGSGKDIPWWTVNPISTISVTFTDAFQGTGRSISIGLKKSVYK
jgi:hypothetical protein